MASSRSFTMRSLDVPAGHTMPALNVSADGVIAVAVSPADAMTAATSSVTTAPAGTEYVPAVLSWSRISSLSSSSTRQDSPVEECCAVGAEHRNTPNGHGSTPATSHHTWTRAVSQSTSCPTSTTSRAPPPELTRLTFCSTCPPVTPPSGPRVASGAVSRSTRQDSTRCVVSGSGPAGSHRSGTGDPRRGEADLGHDPARAAWRRDPGHRHVLVEPTQHRRAQQERARQTGQVEPLLRRGAGPDRSEEHTSELQSRE